MAISTAEDERATLKDVAPEDIEYVKNSLQIDTIDGGENYYVYSSYFGRNGMYLHHDAMFYRSCGVNGFFRTYADAEDCIRRFFEGGNEIVLYKDGVVTNTLMYKKYRISDG